MTTATTTERPRPPTRERAALAGVLIAGAPVVPLTFWIGVDESFSGPKVVAMGAIAALAIVRARPLSRLRLPPWHRVDTAVAIFAALTVLSFLVSVDRVQSFWGERFQRQGLLATAAYLGFYAAARVSLTDPRRLRLLLRSISVGATLVAVYAVGQRIGFDPIWDELPSGRVFSTIGQTNSLGAYLALVLPLSVGLALTARRRPGLYWLAAALQGLALVFTVSRGAYVGVALGAALLTVAYLCRRGWQWQGAAAVTVAAALGLSVVALLTPGVSDSTARVIDGIFSEEDWANGSIRSHIDLWEVAAHITADNPVLGTGPETYPEVFGDYRDVVLDRDSARYLRQFRLESPHNIVVTAAAGSGIPAAVALVVSLVGAIAVAISTAWSATTRENHTLLVAVAASLLAAFTASLFITADLSTMWLMWMLCGAVVGIAAQDRRS